MAWTVLSFPFGSILTSTKMTQMYDNFAAFAAKDSGAPELANLYVVTAMLNDLGVTAAKIANTTITQGKMAASSIGQGEVKTTTAATNSGVAGSTGSKTMALTGGTYSMWTAGADSGGASPVGWGGSNTAAGTMGWYAMDNADQLYVDERYFQASPPYHRLLYVSALVDINGDVQALSVAPDPIWAYHGPTNISPQRVDSAGRAFRRVKVVEGQPLTSALRFRTMRERFVRGELTVEEVEQELTLDYKDSDKDIMPHPWITYAPGFTPVLLTFAEAMEQRLHGLLQEVGAGNVRNELQEMALRADNVRLEMPGVPNVIDAVRARLR